MNKAELIEAMSQATGHSKADAGRSLDALLSVVSDTLARGDSIALTGFGTFAVSRRDARTGRNPQTGAAIQIAASNEVKFKVGAKLKAAVNPEAG